MVDTWLSDLLEGEMMDLWHHVLYLVTSVNLCV